MSDHNDDAPIHPGVYLDQQHLQGKGVTAVALDLGISKATLSRLLSGKSDMTARNAVLLEERGFGTAKEWMDLQAERSIYLCRKELKLE